MKVKLLAVAAAGLCAAPALAQEPPAAGVPEEDIALPGQPEAGPEATFDVAPPFRLSGEIGLVTDYRDRGVTQSDGDPAVQASAEVAHQSGLYAGLFGSTLAGEPPFGDVEVNVYGGYRRAVAGGVEIDVGATYHLYPDRAEGSDTDYLEPFASLSYRLGPAVARVGALYAYEQEGLGDADSLTVFGELASDVPSTPFTVVASLGWTDGALSPAGGDHLDWRVGLETPAGPLRVGVFYVDTDLPGGFGGGSTLVLSGRFAF